MTPFFVGNRMQNEVGSVSRHVTWIMLLFKCFNFNPDEVEGATSPPETDFDPGSLSMQVENAARAYRVENFSMAAQVLRSTVAEVDNLPVNIK